MEHFHLAVTPLVSVLVTPLVLQQLRHFCCSNYVTCAAEVTPIIPAAVTPLMLLQQLCHWSLQQLHHLFCSRYVTCTYNSDATYVRSSYPTCLRSSFSTYVCSSYLAGFCISYAIYLVTITLLVLQQIRHLYMQKLRNFCCSSYATCTVPITLLVQASAAPLTVAGAAVNMSLTPLVPLAVAPLSGEAFPRQ